MLHENGTKMELQSPLYTLAALPWLVLSPLNVIKLLLNTVSPTAHLWVVPFADTRGGGAPRPAVRATPGARDYGWRAGTVDKGVGGWGRGVGGWGLGM